MHLHVKGREPPKALVLILLSDRTKDVLGVSISIIRFEYLLYINARDYNLHKKMQTSYIKFVPHHNGEGFITLARGILLNREEGKLGSNSQISGHE